MEILKIRGNQNFDLEVFAPSSKSFSHRYILAAFLSRQKVRVSNIIYSKDTLATLYAIKNIGANVVEGEDFVDIHFENIIKSDDLINIDCNESASTLRFIIPIVAAFGIKSKIFGKKSLMDRPLNVYTKLFDEIGLKYEYKKGEYIKILGKLEAGNYKVDGDISSQFITGILFALSILNENSTLTINKNLESKPYVDITINVLEFFGIKIKNNDYKSFEIEKNQKYLAKDVVVEGDYSQGCAFIGAGLLGGRIKIKNLLKNSPQGDKMFIDFMKELGGKIEVFDDYIICEKSNLISNKTFDISHCPDIAPVLASVCAISEGKTVIKGIKRLRIKESDRVKSICTVLKNFGIDVQSDEENIIINGKKHLCGGTFDTFNDHRIAMMICVAAINCDDEILIKEPMCVEKSYPNFYNEFDKIIKILD